jgi:hypothetical protein
MLVFISWSGNRSKRVAEALERWLSHVIQAVDPWLSLDIEKGARWSATISERLEQSKVGIICVSRDNVDSHWLLFEAGALSKAKDTHVCTLLIDLRPADLSSPLAQFQATIAEKEDVRRLAHTINLTVQRSGERFLSDQVLDDTFELHWPRLNTVLKEVAQSPGEGESQKRLRTDREILEEVLEILRRQDKQQIQRPTIDDEIARLRGQLGAVSPAAEATLSQAIRRVMEGQKQEAESSGGDAWPEVGASKEDILTFFQAVLYPESLMSASRSYAGVSVRNETQAIREGALNMMKKAAILHGLGSEFEEWLGMRNSG